jgi:hypothetical protein
MGLSGLQSAFERQTSSHLMSPLQKGADGGQSLLDRHPTQRPSRTKQNGAAKPQFAFVKQPTHCAVAALQSGVGVPAQSASALHPMQTPVGASQMAVLPEQVPTLQAPWHV